MKKAVAFLVVTWLIFAACAAQAATPSRWAHAYRYGDRTQPRIALTIDDWMYPDQWLPEFMAVAEEYGVKLTLYPSGYNLHAEDRTLWQAALDAGHVIGSHFYQHKRLTEMSAAGVARELEKFQIALDETLGYHYEFLSVRPPYGAGLASGGNGKVGRWIHGAGFDHIVLWDVDETSNLKTALRQIKNGSIVLMHANHRDLLFFRSLMEALQERGYEYVTINELLNITSRIFYVED